MRSRCEGGVRGRGSGWHNNTGECYIAGNEGWREGQLESGPNYQFTALSLLVRGSCAGQNSRLCSQLSSRGPEGHCEVKQWV